MSQLKHHHFSIYHYAMKMGLIPDTVDNLLYQGKIKSPKKVTRLSQFKGGFYPLLDLFNDVKDVFTPYYRSRWHALKDLFRPFAGLSRVLKGIFYLLAIIPLSVFIVIQYARNSANFNDFLFNISIGAVRVLSWLISAVSNIIYGAYKILTSPLTYLLLIPKLIISKCIPEKARFAENRHEIQSLVDDAIDLIPKQEWSSIVDIIDEVHQKYTRGVMKRDEITNGMNRTAESIKYECAFDTDRGVKLKDIKEYLSFFSKNLIGNKELDEKTVLYTRLERRF
ncbi:MAG: hypothetical protein H0U70_06510 [Tatlockia sp.]|nr:hypothetical protein [Tatlockia sp.]